MGPDLTRIGRELADIGYTEAGVCAALQTPEVRRSDFPLYSRRLDDEEPLAPLIRLFVLGEHVAAGSLPLPATELAAAGLISIESEEASARLRLTPWADLLFAHDPEDVELLARDHVTGVNAASRTLAALTVRRNTERALDLGTGCGVQAIVAARHTQRVVATDVNERALGLARLNAALNGVEVETAHGSWFDPVADERFGLIVSNPPFVISPDTEYVFRDSDLRGDVLCRRVVEQVASFLSEGGFATVLCNWACSDADESWQPLHAWVEGIGCAALLLAYAPMEPTEYAARWNAPLRSDPLAYEAAIDRWTDYYERERICAIGFGAIVLRRGDPAWTRAIEMTEPVTADASAQLLRLFTATDEASLLSDDDALLAARLELVDGHRLEQTLAYESGEYAVREASIALDRNPAFSAPVDAYALQVLFRLDGKRPLASVLEEAAAESGFEQDELATAAMATLRALHERGFLLLR